MKRKGRYGKERIKERNEREIKRENVEHAQKRQTMKEKRKLKTMERKGNKEERKMTEIQGRERTNKRINENK